MANETSEKKTTPEPKRQWKNPALRMMGIPKPKLPSRNWMIFWSVVIGLGSTYAYDKYQQNQIRNRYMKLVEEDTKKASYQAGLKPRKLTIYVAPPPNDFLDESLKIFRKFIKPILNASCIDFEIFSESRQGDIRSSVAEKIRELRRQKSDLSTPEVSSFEKIKTEELKPRSELYKSSDVLGLYKVLPTKIEIESEEKGENIAGGIICIGRGAFKEYLTGLHEGLLGPLNKSEEVKQMEIELEEKKQKMKEEHPEDFDDEDSKLKPVPIRYISSKDYQEASLAPELHLTNESLKDDNQIAYFFEQPIYVFSIPKLTGFKNFPKKMYNFFTKRYLTEDLSEKTLAIVNKDVREFKFKDTLLAKEEELVWPKSWVEKGLERNSEWVQNLDYDDRVISRLKVFDCK